MTWIEKFCTKIKISFISRASNIESDNSQNVGLEDYNNISDGIIPYFTTPLNKDNPREEEIGFFFQILMLR